MPSLLFPYQVKKIVVGAVFPSSNGCNERSKFLLMGSKGLLFTGMFVNEVYL